MLEFKSTTWHSSNLWFKFYVIRYNMYAPTIINFLTFGADASTRTLAASHHITSLCCSTIISFVHTTLHCYIMFKLRREFGVAHFNWFTALLLVWCSFSTYLANSLGWDLEITKVDLCACADRLKAVGQSLARTVEQELSLYLRSGVVRATPIFCDKWIITIVTVWLWLWRWGLRQRWDWDWDCVGLFSVFSFL